MSQPQAPKPAKLVIGLFMREKHLLAAVCQDLTPRFGSIDMVSPWFAFDFTKYYETEMGAPLSRRLIVFKDLVRQGDLADVKLFTNSIEKKYARQGKRLVNIDPGYMLPERFVLATGKNYSHRIYIGKGIYADLTLVYRQGSFQTLDWTYPDYADPGMRSYLNSVRKKYIEDLKQESNS
jgi:hypothetical protein